MEASRLAFPDRSVDEVYCSHVLEHLSKHEVMDVLVEWNRVVKPGGKVEIIVPDLPWCMKQWLRLPDSARWDWPLDTIFGLQDHPGEFHKTGFSTDRLHYLLQEAGFEAVNVSTCFDHGMQSIRALASAGDAVPEAKGTDVISWVRKQIVFLFYRICAGMPRFRLKKRIDSEKGSRS